MTSYRCLLVQAPQDDRGGPQATVVELPEERFPTGEVTIQVRWSSLNYKDALATTGHRGVVKHLPHIPGIDAAGVILASKSPEHAVGDSVIVTGYELGQSHWGGWSEIIRVPGDWIVPLPIGLSAREAMIYGTAGFTAAQCVMALQVQGIMPGDGEIVVTGASGGVGSLAVRLLASLGYAVVAVSGKADWHSQLIRWGATRVLDRGEFQDDPTRPMLSARWAGGIDAVGGPMLARMIRETRYGGAVAACGLVAGTQLDVTLYPFLLRGVTLCGIASADCPRDKRLKIWSQLAGAWKLATLDEGVTESNLQQLPDLTNAMLRGEVAGRVVVSPGD
ncbi:MAG TPA: oxidoreductase [Planctomycetaceae bacterium]|nr:oxidoreductase [Planctomycetaceae bacterium]